MSNPDGSTGITLHLVVDQQIAAADADTDLNPVWTEFDVIKAKYFAAARAPYFHYMVFANQYDGGFSSGISRGIPAHDFLVTLGSFDGTEQQQAGTLMHELGHNIGLRHGGNDDTNYKPNYLSIMNYEYQFYGFGIGGMDGVLDYSRVRVASFNEAAVNEVAAFAPVAPTTEVGPGARSAGCASTTPRSLVRNASQSWTSTTTASIDSASYRPGLQPLRRREGRVPRVAERLGGPVYDGGGQIGFATPGITQDLGREELFLVAPEKMEPCLTGDPRDAR